MSMSTLYPLLRNLIWLKFTQICQDHCEFMCVSGLLVYKTLFTCFCNSLWLSQCSRFLFCNDHWALQVFMCDNHVPFKRCRAFYSLLFCALWPIFILNIHHIYCKISFYDEYWLLFIFVRQASAQLLHLQRHLSWHLPLPMESCSLPGSSSHHPVFFGPGILILLLYLFYCLCSLRKVHSCVIHALYYLDGT